MAEQDSKPFRWLPIAPEGAPVIVVLAAGSALLTSVAWWMFAPAGWAVAIIGLVVTGWAAWFFRDPERAAPEGEDLVVAPADGAIVGIGPASPPHELGLEQSANPPGPMVRLSIFMNIFNVHVNRAPVAATVERIAYTPGKFFNASLDKASEHNERCALALALPDGRRLAVVQIAGLVAQRIVCRVREGQVLRAGERIGLIRFGSRVDLYVPPGTEVLAQPGQKTVAGRTVLARLGSLGTPPLGGPPLRGGAVPEGMPTGAAATDASARPGGFSTGEPMPQPAPEGRGTREAIKEA